MYFRSIAHLNFACSLVNMKAWFIQAGIKHDENSLWRTQRGAPSRFLPGNSVARPHSCGATLAEYCSCLHRSLRGRGARFLVLAVGLLWHPASFAVTPSPHIDSCSWESIAAKYSGLNPYLLYAIAKQESSLNPKVVSRPNSNGTVDIGLMQINSAWLPTLSSRFGISRSDLFRSCVNLDVGAWILYENFKTFGYSWRAIGAYNAKSEDKRLAYVRKVYRYVPPEMKQ